MLKAACQTDRGMQRVSNQDSLLFMSNDNLYMVADGVGGHNSGELASKLAVEYVRAYADANPVEQAANDVSLKEYFLRCFEIANSLIFNQAALSEESIGMATTAVLAYIRSDMLYVVNIGDSRAYLIRDERIHQITEDHTFVNELLKKGTITREEALNHPDGNMITRALGSEEQIRPDFYQVHIKSRDRILLCTDGLYNEIGSEELCHMATETEDLEVLADKLIKLANARGGADNITAICIGIEELEKEKSYE